jgi:His-Xaa-Ser system protein HxsD
VLYDPGIVVLSLFSMDEQNFELNLDKNQILAFINPDLYDLDVVYGASYNFVDQAYIYLDGDPEEEIKVRLRGKQALNKKELQDLAGEFLNELVNVGLRYQISEKNKKIREYVVSTALAGASGELKEELAREQRRQADKQRQEGSEAEWQKDPEDIAVPWEEKYKGEDENPSSNPDKKELYEENSEGKIVPSQEEEEDSEA